MQQEEQSTKVANEQPAEVRHGRLFNELFVWTSISVFIPLGFFFLSLFYYSFRVSSFHVAPDLFRRWFIFIAGLFLLEMVIVGIGAFIRHKNRDVFLLRTRLAEIYLSALRKSAFNPKLGSSTPND